MSMVWITVFKSMRMSPQCWEKLNPQQQKCGCELLKNERKTGTFHGCLHSNWIFPRKLIDNFFIIMNFQPTFVETFHSNKISVSLFPFRSQFPRFLLVNILSHAKSQPMNYAWWDLKKISDENLKNQQFFAGRRQSLKKRNFEIFHVKFNFQHLSINCLCDLISLTLILTFSYYL